MNLHAGFIPQEVFALLYQKNPISCLYFILAKADEALKAKEKSEEAAKKRKEEGNVIFYFLAK